MTEIKKYKVTDGIIIYFASLLAASLLSLVIKSEKNEQFNIYAGYFIMQACFFAAVLIFSRLKKTDLFYNIPIRSKISGYEIITAVILSFCLFAFTLLPVLAYALLGQASGMKAVVSLPALDSPGAAILSLAILCAMPAVCEELLVRGVFLQGMQSYGGVKALLFSSAVFALMHLNLMQLIHQFTVGLALGYIVLRTQKPVLAMVIHFVNNVIALFLPLALPFELTLSGASLVYFIPMMLAGAFLGLCAVRVLVKSSFLPEGKGIKAYLILWKQSAQRAAKGLRSLFKPLGAENLKGDFVASLPKESSSPLVKAERAIVWAFLIFLALMGAVNTFA
jgi:membrane protease YdiL (CAAX protease family)